MRTLATLLLLSVIAAGTVFAKSKKQTIIPLKTGDLVFQSLPRNPIVDAIEGSTGSPFSHCGIVVEKEGDLLVLEAIGPVRYTELSKWIHRGRRNAYAAYRIQGISSEKIAAFISAADRYLGRPYDIHYDFDDGRIYCSELIYKAYRTVFDTGLGTPEKLGSLKWQPYERVIRAIENGALPLEREMITPVSLAEAPETVFLGGRGFGEGR